MWGLGCCQPCVHRAKAVLQRASAARPMGKFSLGDIKPQVARCPVGKADVTEGEGCLSSNRCENFDIFS